MGHSWLLDVDLLFSFLIFGVWYWCVVSCLCLCGFQESMAWFPAYIAQCVKSRVVIIGSNNQTQSIQHFSHALHCHKEASMYEVQVGLQTETGDSIFQLEITRL
jgi:hypothetical protein